MTVSAYTRPIFYDLEFDGIVENEGTSITEIAAFDPTRPEGKNRFYVLLDPSKGVPKKIAPVNFSNPTANLKKFKFEEVWPKFQAWIEEEAAP